MTALVDAAFRVFAAASQGDDARVRALLADMTEDEVVELARVVGGLRVPISCELVARAIGIVREPS